MGNHCDECATEVSLPFPFTLYDQTFNSVDVTANGTMNFMNSGNTGGINFCLPYSGLGYSILPHWDDLQTYNFTCTNCGIFTSVSGTAPNRIFNIEWRTQYWDSEDMANFEVRLYEGTTNQRFDIVYGAVTRNGNGATIGVQKDTGTRYTEWGCNEGGITPGLQLTFVMQVCATATPAPPTNTPGAATSTSTTVAPSQTSVATVTGVPATGTAVVSTPTSTIGAQAPRPQKPLYRPLQPAPSPSQTYPQTIPSTTTSGVWPAGASSQDMPTVRSSQATT